MNLQNLARCSYEYVGTCGCVVERKLKLSRQPYWTVP